MKITIEEYTNDGLSGYLVLHDETKSWFASLQEALKFIKCKLTGIQYTSIFTNLTWW